MWCTSARLFRRVTLVEPWMDTAATDGSAKRSRVDRLKQRRLRRGPKMINVQSHRLTTLAGSATVRRTYTRLRLPLPLAYP